MSVENKNRIDELLGVTGIFINSTLFSAQLRKRYYWTNLNVDLNIEDKGIELQSILKSGYTDRKKASVLYEIMPEAFKVQIKNHLLGCATHVQKKVF